MLRGRVLRAELLLMNFNFCELGLELPYEALKFFFEILFLSSLVCFNKTSLGLERVYQAGHIVHYL